MNFGEVIQTWKSDYNWVNGIPNPYVKKDVNSVIMNPTVLGEVILQFCIIDNTVLANGQLCSYQRTYEYHTFCLNGTDEEKETEAVRLQHELSDFTNTAILERSQQIESMRNEGFKIFTTNPYEW